MRFMTIRLEAFASKATPTIVGNVEANRELSEDRAEAVVNWLTEHGIERSRLTAKGYGQSRPVGSNATHQAGKRIAASK
jgi:outer membrane protein OmpA-like peptidoglycan-associated protein